MPGGDPHTSRGRWVVSVVVEAGEVPPDRFRLVDELGSGGMADVYLAVDALLDREVAVKVLAPDRIGDAASFGRPELYSLGCVLEAAMAAAAPPGEQPGGGDDRGEKDD